MTTFSSYDSTVNSFYLAFYGRPADPAGLKFWSKQLADNDGDLGAITGFFAASDEAQVRFGTDTVAERIAEIYQQLFNRAPEATGLAFWTKAIENGDASMADVAVSILKGAQGTDAGLATLRQQAVDAFTAQVDAEGSQYDGYASIEAARILVRAVTADASANDLAALVKAAVSFADTATKNPAVVEAIAVNTTLLALFDTPRGNGDPVALAQALADTAKAAAGDPVTLEQLLRGGGMDKVLKVMPANATLQDVVKALAEGGLPAAVEVVYPSTPSVPPTPSYKLSFVGVTQGEGDTAVDHVTRKEIVDATFSYRGNDLNSSQKYEYSINGGEWISGSEYIEVDTKTNTVVLKNIDLSQGEVPVLPKSFMGIMGEGPIADLLSNIELRAVRSDNSVIDSFKQQIVYDHHAAQPVVSVTLSEAAEYFNGGNFTSVPTLFIDGLEPGAKVEYSLVMNHYQRTPGPSQTEWSVKAPDLTQDGEYTVLVRQTDVSGNISDASQFTFTLDREEPLAPTIALQADTGIPGDGVTNIAKVKITGLETSSHTGWQYSTNGVDWKFGKTNDGSGSAVLDLGTPEAGTVEVQVRQIDAAGNVGDASDALSFTFDAVPPAYSISFDSVQQGKNDKNPDDKVTNVKSADVKFSYTGAVADGLHFEYSVDGGQHWLTTNLVDVDGVVTIGGVDLSAGSLGGNAPGRMSIMEADPLENLFTTVQLRLVDANAFEYASASETVELDRFAEMLEVGVTKSLTALHFDQHGVAHTKVAAINVKGLEEGAVVQYANISNNPDVTTFTDVLPSLQDGKRSFLVRQQDAAGNYSHTQEITFTLDRVAPDAPTLALEIDSGTAGDGITNVNQIAIGDLEQSVTSAWEYRIDGGEWTFGQRNDGSGNAVLTLAGLEDGTFDIEVRQFDAAGNVGDKTGKLSFELDTTAPVGKFSQTGIEGASKSDSRVTDLQVADVYFTFDGEIEATDTFEYMLDSGKWQTLAAEAYDSATGILTVGEVDFSTKDRDVTVRVTDAAGNTTTSKSMLVDSTHNNPPAVTIDSLTPTFGVSGAKLALKVSIDSLASVDKTKLSLDVMNTGTAVDAPGFFDGNTSQLTGNTLTLDDIPALNLYQLGWEEGAFTTTGGAAVAAGSALFVGGKIATVALPGYAIESLDLVGETGIDESNDVRVNTAFIGQEDVNARIHSGDGHDVVVDNGSKLTLSYDKLSNTLSDVVFGFDSSNGIASDIDKIELGGAISTRFDVNHNGALEWGTAVSPTTKYVPQPGIEAVELANLTSKSFIALAGADPLGALNATLDVSGFDAGEGLLILGTYQSQSILLSYVSKDSNGKVDEGELVTIAIYAQGTVDTDDITLVGSFMPPP